MTEHGEAIDADLQREYSLSLNDWAGGRVSTRRLLGLIANLPPEGTSLSRHMAEAAKGKPAKAVEPPDWWWTPERDFLARLVDLGKVDLWAKSDPKRRGPMPEPIDRPSVRAARRAPDGEVPVSPGVALAALAAVAPVSLN